jgi:hypothetical protein
VTSLADPTGFEPAISSVTGWHVWPLHHGSARTWRIADFPTGHQRFARPDLSNVHSPDCPSVPQGGRT